MRYKRECDKCGKIAKLYTIKTDQVLWIKIFRNFCYTCMLKEGFNPSSSRGGVKSIKVLK